MQVESKHAWQVAKAKETALAMDSLQNHVRTKSWEEQDFANSLEKAEKKQSESHHYTLKSAQNPSRHNLGKKQEQWCSGCIYVYRRTTCILSWESWESRTSASKRALSHCDIWLSFDEFKGFMSGLSRTRSKVSILVLVCVVDIAGSLMPCVCIFIRFLRCVFQ